MKKLIIGLLILTNFSVFADSYQDVIHLQRGGSATVGQTTIICNGSGSENTVKTCECRKLDYRHAVFLVTKNLYGQVLAAVKIEDDFATAKFCEWGISTIKRCENL